MNSTLIDEVKKKEICIVQILDLIKISIDEDETDKDQSISVLLPRQKHVIIPNRNLSKKSTSQLNFKKFFPLDISFDVLYFNEKEFAFQLTYITHSIMSKITKKEMLNKNWESKNKKVDAPNIIMIKNRYNQLYDWITEEILRYDRKRHRKLAIEKFIKIADECWKINNFNDCFIIIVCLTTSEPLLYLKKTWYRISFESQKKLDELEYFFLQDNNWGNLRNVMDEVEGKPCLPYFGYFLNNLNLKVEDKYVDNGRIINCEKIRKIGELIDQFHELVNKNVYAITENSRLNFLYDLKPLSVDELYKLAKRLGNFTQIIIFIKNLSL